MFLINERFSFSSAQAPGNDNKTLAELGVTKGSEISLVTRVSSELPVDEFLAVTMSWVFEGGLTHLGFYGAAFRMVNGKPECFTVVGQTKLSEFEGALVRMVSFVS